MDTGLALSAGQDGAFQHLFAAHDPHLAVVDLDAVDERAQVGLAERDLPGRELLAHGPREALDDDGARGLHAPCGRSCPLERGLRLRPSLLEVGDARPQDVVDFVAAVLDEPVDPAQPFIRLLRLVRHGGSVTVDQMLHRVLHFDRFALDLTRGCVRMGDRTIELRPKAFDVLRHLAENPGRLVPKQELYDAVWPNVVVTDDSLVQCIRELRQKLGDDDHRLIKTVSRRGYMLDAKPMAGPKAETPSPQRPAEEHNPAIDEPEPLRRLAAGRLILDRLRRDVQWPAWALVGVLAFVGLAGVYAAVRSTTFVGDAGGQTTRASLRSSAESPPRPTFKDCEVCPEMVELPPGEFMMGSPEGESGRRGHEGPQRRVVLSERIAIGRFEVTIDEFATFVAEAGFAPSDACYLAGPSGWQLARAATFREPGFRVTGSHPAVCVSWHDAKAYAAWLVGKTGRGYRLPSEGEWEYAARAGTTTAYSFGDDPVGLCEFARFADADSGFSWRSGCHSGRFEPGPLPVGSLPPNPWGLHDMHGNVWEWVEDCWTTDARLLPSDGSAYSLPGGCKLRSMRGGAWAASPDKLRSAHRLKVAGDKPRYHLGFRVAVSLGK